MNITIILISALILTMYFTITIFDITRKYKNTPFMLNNYPEDIREEYFKTHERVDVSLKSKKVLFVKLLALLLFVGILFALAYISGAKSFMDGFLFAFGMMLWIGIYDTLFIDFVLFANLKFFRLEGTENMDKEYHQKWFHVKGLLFPGLLFGFIPAVMVGLGILAIR